MTNKFLNAGITDFSFVKAVDGKTLQPSEQIKLLFEGNDFQYRKAIIGCALSHVNLWQSLVRDEPDDTVYLILEDDVELSPHFNAVLNTLELDKIANGNVDVLFVGYIKKINDNETSTNYTLLKLNQDNFFSGAFAYILTKSGAKKLLSMKTIVRAIDYAFFSTMGKMNLYEISPLIVTSEVAYTGNKIDSDIQRDFERFTFENYTTVSKKMPNYLELISLSNMSGEKKYFLATENIENTQYHKNYDKLIKNYISLMDEDKTIDIIVVGWNIPHAERLKNIQKYFVGSGQGIIKIDGLPQGASFLLTSTSARKLLKGEKVNIMETSPHLIFDP